MFASTPGPRVPLYRTGSYQTKVPASASLFESVAKGDASGAASALALGAKALSYFEGSTALHAACEANAPALLELLLSSYAADVVSSAGSGQGGDAADAAMALADALNARTDANQATLLAVASGAGAKVAILVPYRLNH
jgi:hypothetical protein